MIEVERKYRLTQDQADAVALVLRSWGTPTVVRQIDQVFLFDTDSFEGFEPGRPVIRLRSLDNDGASTITVKRTINGSGDCVEHETVVGSATVMESILAELGYRQAVEVAKTRMSVRRGRLTYSLDQVESLGPFLEVEAIAATEDGITSLTSEIESAASELRIARNAIEARKYDVLLAGG